jgi:UDP-GlcNAc:undecaprenyl-phosphate/decaprenyl-phosphate GlcNAc-1-phosphate transferase
MARFILTCLLIAGAATGASGALILSLRRWSLRAVGDGRRIGGPALVLGLAAGGAIGLSRLPWLLIAGLGAILVLGLLDDRFNLPPWQKLIGQGVAVALAVAAQGPVRRVLFVVPVDTGPLAVAVPILWLLATTNAANLIDGLDGLAACVLIPSFAALGTLALGAADPTGTLVALAAAGALVAFTPFNRRPAHLLLGDTGAEFLGFLLGVLTLRILSQGPNGWSAGPALLLALVPLADTAFAVARRVMHGRSILRGDRQHIHHRLAARLGESRTVLLLAIVATLSALFAALVQTPL